MATAQALIMSPAEEETEEAPRAEAAPVVTAPRSDPPSRTNWKPVVTGLAGLYLAAAISHLVQRPDLWDWRIFTLVTGTGIALLVLRWFFGSKSLPLTRAESVGAALAGLVLLNTLFHLYLLSDGANTLNLALLGVGIATFFLPCARLTLILAVTLGFWLVAAWSMGTTPAWLHFAFGLFAAAGLRLHTEFRATEMRRAYAAAESEIAKREEMERTLRDAQERFTLAAAGSKDGLWDWDLRTHKVYYSPRWRAMIGYDGELGEHPSEWLQRIHPQDRSRVRNALLTHVEGVSPHFEAEYRIRHAGGNYLWMLARGMAVHDKEGKAYRIAGSQTDVTARKVAEEQLLHDALHDHLSGLPNRALFIERLQNDLKRRICAPQYQFALLFLDLDRFKIVNDSLGHLAGDEMLRLLARRLEGSLRPVDTVARFGGDEFAILLSDLRSSRDAVAVAERILKAIQIPFCLGGHQVFTTGSIGIVMSSPDYIQADEMLRDADLAMYRAKAHGKGSYELFNGEMLNSAITVLQLESDLRNALKRHEFCLHYQPIISLEDGHIEGFEALIRWNHPERGLLAPGQFLSVAEDADLLVPIGWQVLRQACEQLRVWKDKNPEFVDLSVSVNLSAKQYSCPDLVSKVDRVLSDTGVNPRALKLEITEGVIMQSVESSIRILGELRERGIDLHLDDFGTGYSALSYLHQFPITTIKTDRSFLSRNNSVRENRAVLLAIIQMARNLGMEVVVEGVETPEQLANVTALGCGHAQGFLFSKPLEAQAAAILLDKGGDLRPQSFPKELPLSADSGRPYAPHIS